MEIKFRKKGGIQVKSRQEKREEYLQKIKEFRLFDDEFLSRIFDENIECTELILHIILDNPDIKVRRVRTQREIKNLKGHSVRLDIAAINSNDEPIDIEVQRADKGAGVKRARYNSSIMDANTLVKSEDYDNLPESYVIFIAEHDIMGANLPVYRADRIVLETGKALGDGSHIIYVNGEYQDDSPVGKLMHDFFCKDPKDMYYEPLARQMRYYKEDAKGVESMCRIMEELIDQEKREMVLKMKKSGKLSNEDIAEFTGFTVKEVEAVSEENAVVV